MAPRVLKILMAILPAIGVEGDVSQKWGLGGKNFLEDLHTYKLAEYIQNKRERCGSGFALKGLCRSYDLT